jgi:hypothetical protein
MRSASLILGALLIVVGAVWTVQGVGTLKGSFMTGSRVWMWIGIACVCAGIAVLVTSFVSNKR